MKKASAPVIEYASPGLPRIFAAMVYDSLLLVAISIAYGAIIVALQVFISGQPAAGERVHWGVTAEIFITFGWLAVLILFYVYFWHRFGQTLGMKTWRIQVVDAQTNGAVSYGQGVKRSLAALLSLLLLGGGYWCSLLHPKQRLLHDLLSGTRLLLLKKK